jgi:hypothetical protein
MLRTALPVLSTVLAALGAATLPASASAAVCPGSGSGVVLCSGGLVQEGTFGFTGVHKAGTAISLEVAELMNIECTTTSSKGQFVGTGSSVEANNLVVEWSGCVVPGHAGCKVTPIKFGVGSGLKGSLVGTGEIKLSPMEGTKYSELIVRGCSTPFEAPIEGSQSCSLPESTVEATKHVEVCAPAGSRLTAVHHTVNVIYYEEIGLSSGKAFSFQKN